MKISVVIIAKNEARNIGRCLASLEGVADEIIVVDGFSEDGTQDICRSHGAKVLEHEWMGYSATKNWGNEQAQHGYILSLDADEALSDELKAAMLEAKPHLNGIYSFNRLAFYCGQAIRRAGWYPDRKPRLFPKGKARWEGAFVHETLVGDPDLTPKVLSGDLLHYTYYTQEEHVTRARRYAELAAGRIAESRKSNLILRAHFSSLWRFVQMYLIKGGFLEGKYGYSLCRITAREVYWKYSGAARLRKEA